MALTSEQQQIVDKATLTKTNGWQYLTVEGSPYEIGFEHGYLLTDEFKDAIRVYTHMTLETMGMDYSFFVEQAVKLHKSKIPDEYIEEMQGMADGFTAGGFETSLDDVIGWNSLDGAHRLLVATGRRRVLEQPASRTEGFALHRLRGHRFGHGGRPSGDRA